MISVFIGTLLFIIRLEFNDMGNIWYRNNQLVFSNLISYFLAPFHIKSFWYPDLFSINWIIVVLSVMSIEYLIIPCCCHCFIIKNIISSAKNLLCGWI